MSCLSYCLCSDSEKKAEQEQKLTLIIVHLLHEGSALRRRGVREAGQGKGKRSKSVYGLN